MENIKTILVPTDFSVPADYAVYYAWNLAKLFNASIILYHSFIPFETGFYPPKQSQKENRLTEVSLLRRLAWIKDVLSKKNKEVLISIHVDRGPESIRIIEFCENNNIDLVVMGTKGASGIKEVLMGSFTADVMVEAPCPVLAIPVKSKFKIPQIITYASGYREQDIQPISYLLQLNNYFGAKINILHVDDGEQESPLEAEKALVRYKSKIEKNVKDSSLSFHHIKGKDISGAILDFTLNSKTDMLVLSPVKREGMLNRLFHKSLTKKVAYHIHLPLLAIPSELFLREKNVVNTGQVHHLV